MQGLPSGKLRERKREQRDGDLAEGFECRSPALNAELCRSKKGVGEREIGAEIEREGFQQETISIYAHDADLARFNDNKLLGKHCVISRSAYNHMWGAAYGEAFPSTAMTKVVFCVFWKGEMSKTEKPSIPLH